MKRLSLLLALVMLFSGCCVFNQMQAIKNLDYEYDSFQLGAPTLSGMSFIVKIKITNPNKADVTLKKVGYQITVDGMKVAEGKSEDEYVIKKKQSVLYPTKLIVNYNDAADFATKFSMGKDTKVNVKGDAEFKTSFGTYAFPFSVEKSLSEISKE